MRIGITYDLKADLSDRPDLPDDFQEEFDSPATVEAIGNVLRGLGHQVELLGDGRELLQRLLADPPEFVFNFAEGQGVGRCREARVPAVLEMLGIPYTGSDALSLAATLDKDVARRLVQTAGVDVPWGTVWQPGESLDEIATRHSLPRSPLIVKPAWEGSSKGIRGKCVVDTPEELAEVIETLRQSYQQPILTEEFIAGDELTVGVIGNYSPRVIGVMRVIPQQPEDRFVYSLEVKRDWQRRVRYECPAQLPPRLLEAIESTALTCYKALGCRDVARVDFRLRDGTPYFLEANPLPGLNPDYSDLVILARGMGWTYERLIGTILEEAIDRQARTATTVTTART
jgi:D-alanine-D-alanine ligase